MVIFPLPMSDVSRRLGSIENLTLGSKQLKVIIPPNVRVGQKVRLKGIAHYIDPQLHNEDLYLLIQAPKPIAYEFRRDIHLSLPLKDSLFFNNYVQKDQWEILMIANKKLEVKIPAGFQIGKKIRLAGMAKYGNGGYEGDVYLSPTIVSQPTIWTAFFNNFSKPAETKISLKFSIPFFLEFAGEWIFKKSIAELTASNIK